MSNQSRKKIVRSIKKTDDPISNQILASNGKISE